MSLIDLYRALPEFHKISGQFTVDELNTASKYYELCQEDLFSKYNPVGYLIMILKTGIIEQRIQIAKKAIEWKKSKKMNTNSSTENYQKKKLCLQLSKFIDETGPYFIDDDGEFKHNFRVSLEENVCFLSWQTNSGQKFCFCLNISDKNFISTIDDWCKKLGIEYNNELKNRFKEFGIQTNDTRDTDTVQCTTV